MPTSLASNADAIAQAAKEKCGGGTSSSSRKAKRDPNDVLVCVGQEIIDNMGPLGNLYQAGPVDGHVIDFINPPQQMVDAIDGIDALERYATSAIDMLAPLVATASTSAFISYYGRVTRLGTIGFRRY